MNQWAQEEIGEFAGTNRSHHCQLDFPQIPMTESRHQLESLAELFGEGADGNEFAYRELAIDVSYRGGLDAVEAGGRLLGGLAPHAAFGDAFTQAFAVPEGNYVRIWFLNSLGVDVSLRSKPQPDPERQGLDKYFNINASNERIAHRRLKGTLADALMKLAPNYSVFMRDDYIEFGPLFGNAEQGTSDLQTAVDAVLNLTEKWYDDAREPEVYTGANADFCFYCGFNVPPSTATCPRCSESLVDE